MRVLVTGGSGVIAQGLIPRLLEHGHEVRLLARGADDAARQWPDRVESFSADVTHPGQLLGAAEDCDAVVHISGIVVEEPPDNTFERVNVGGTRNLLLESARAGMPKFIFISSLGVERGSSDYHVSKRAAEEMVREYQGSWVILRPGAVYGPGDQVISVLLGMHRTLPVIPVIGAGDHAFQPIWYLDLGEAIVRALERDVHHETYQVAGAEITTSNNVLDFFERVTSRTPARVPVPEFLAWAGARLAEAAGTSFPISESEFLMLIEGNVIRNAEHNALTRVFEVTPTPLREGLTILADMQPEQTPDRGIGGMEHKRFWADIAGSRFSAESLMLEFRRRVTEVMPLDFDVEPGTPKHIEAGVVLTMALPLRGHIQVRVAEVEPRTVTFATLRGHPMAGVVRFTTFEPGPGIVRFTVSIYARASSWIDWLTMGTVGGGGQNATWRTVVSRVVEMSGGDAPTVQHESEVLRGAEAEQIERMIVDLVAAHHREQHEHLER